MIRRIGWAIAIKIYGGFWKLAEFSHLNGILQSYESAKSTDRRSVTISAEEIFFLFQAYNVRLEKKEGWPMILFDRVR